MEHRDEADQLEREADRMEDESERVGEDIERARRDWDAKKRDASIPGAQPEEGATVETERRESDQLPEEGPADQTPEDTGGEGREEAERTPGVPGEGERGTGQEHEREEHGEQ